MAANEHGSNALEEELYMLESEVESLMKILHSGDGMDTDEVKCGQAHEFLAVYWNWYFHMVHASFFHHQNTSFSTL
jgi:hypothetical protein